jgi:hypothetical protein
MEVRKTGPGPGSSDNPYSDELIFPFFWIYRFFASRGYLFVHIPSPEHRYYILAELTGDPFLLINAPLEKPWENHGFLFAACRMVRRRKQYSLLIGSF